MKFRKKPVVVDTFPVRDAIRCAREDWKGLPSWLAEAYEKGNVHFCSVEVHIQTLEGRIVGEIDDIIIQGVKGELYPCKPDIFAATYEPDDSAEQKAATAPKPERKPKTIVVGSFEAFTMWAEENPELAGKRTAYGYQDAIRVGCPNDKYKAYGLEFRLVVVLRPVDLRMWDTIQELQARCRRAVPA